MGPVGEQKTKPTQHTVKELRGLGITPDLIVCRSKEPLQQEIKQKLAAFCHVEPKAVISAHDVSNLYQIPISFEKQGVRAMIADCIGLGMSGDDEYLEDWRRWQIA